MPELDTNDGVTTPMGHHPACLSRPCVIKCQRRYRAQSPHLPPSLAVSGLSLAAWRRLSLDGDAGDFVGALLDGGEVVVTGNRQLHWYWHEIRDRTDWLQHRQVWVRACAVGRCVWAGALLP